MKKPKRNNYFHNRNHQDVLLNILQIFVKYKCLNNKLCFSIDIVPSLFF